MFINILQTDRSNTETFFISTKQTVKTENRKDLLHKVQDIVDFSPESIKLANTMKDEDSLLNMNKKDAESQFETDLSKIVKNKFRSYTLRPEYKNTTEKALEKGDGGDGNGDDGNSGNEGKIKQLEKKIEEVYSSELPDPAKEEIVKGIRKQIDMLLSEMDRKKK